MPKPSITDGVRCDTEGRVWRSVRWGEHNEDGVRCSPRTANCSARSISRKPSPIAALAGQQRNETYICGSTSLYAVYTAVQGAMKR